MYDRWTGAHPAGIRRRPMALRRITRRAESRAVTFRTMTDTTSNSFPRPAIALLGAGTMGSAMAQRLLDQGFRVGVWNRTPTPLAALTQHGAAASTTPAEAVAAADVVVTMLPNGDVVEDVMLRAGTLESLRANATWAQMSTIGVEA